jgi:membrane associated rhomboid family serine protease
MNDDLRVVFESRDQRPCADRALVLASLGIPHELVSDASSWALLVPAPDASYAVEQLLLYDRENPPRKPRPPVTIEYHQAVPGVVGYVAVLCLVAWLAGTAFLGKDWLAAGRVDGELLREGEWWRTITALTLHADFSHLAGNLLFGSFFGFYAGRLAGSGIAWFAIVVTAACGNALNTFLLESMHRSIGASTAVFSALGLLAGFVWRGRLMYRDQWPYRIGPLVGGVALLMYTGTGDANTDVGAHLMGFLAGLGGGVLLAVLPRIPRRPIWQLGAGAAALLVVAAAWISALRG